MNPATLSSPSTPPARVPRLKYRLETPVSHAPDSALEGKASTLDSPNDTSKGQAPRPAKSKSRFKTFFTLREPTLLALNQVEAQLIAQHGSASATKVPNVRMEKMPDYVPKVNSKWDGIPEQIKAKQKMEKQKQKARKRASMKSQNTDSSSQRRADWSGSHTSNSNASRSKSTTSRRSDLIKPNPHRFYATSCNSSGDLAAQQREDKAKDEQTDDETKPLQPPQSPQSASFAPSRRPLSESGSLHPSDIPPSPSIPDNYRVQATPVQSLNPSLSSGARTSTVQASPKSQLKPQMPDTFSEKSLDEALLEFERKAQSQRRSNDQPATRISSPAKPVNLTPVGFLAGEAHEVTFPDSDELDPIPPLPVQTWIGVHQGQHDKSYNSKKQTPSLPLSAATEKVRPRWRRSMILRTNMTLLEVPDGLRTPPLSSGGTSTKESLGPLTPRTLVAKSLVGSLRSFRS
ncbi:hypothetical protein DV735_g590, partial [Chaetothyriales sp. CBS 134920]